jgi:hypothetical protein
LRPGLLGEVGKIAGVTEIDYPGNTKFEYRPSYKIGPNKYEILIFKNPLHLTCGNLYIFRLGGSRFNLSGWKTMWRCTDVCPKVIPITKYLGQIKRVLKQKEKNQKNL